MVGGRHVSLHELQRGYLLVVLTVVAVLAALLVPAPAVVLAAAQTVIDLPTGYVEDLIHEPGPAGPLVVSHGGAVFMRYDAPGGGTRIGRLDVDTGSLSTVLEVAPWLETGWLVGGPGESFFMMVDGAFLQVASDGTTTTWSTAPLPGFPLRYSLDGRMIGITPDGTSVIEFASDGSTTVVKAGFTQIYDLVVTAFGTVYVSDFPAEQLVEILPNGDSRVVTAIAPDNTNLALDPDDNLYLNNAAVGFNRVDVATGALTPITAPGAPCRAIASPAVVEFDAIGRALFFSWVDHLITWADPASGEGGRIFEPTWANTSAADVGADGALYAGVSGCGTATPTAVMRVTPDGSASMRASAPGIGQVSGLAVTAGGGVFVAVGTETSAGLYYAPSGDPTLRLVPDSTGFDIGSLAAYPWGEQALAYLGADPTDPDAVRLSSFSNLGLIDSYTVAMPEAVAEFTLDIAPNGTVYAQASEAANYFTGPVKRWLLELDLDQGTHDVVFQHDRTMGCCPLDNFGVDSTGHLWWILNPDFVLYHVDPTGTAELFATETPVDVGYVNRNSSGDIFLNSPEGVYRVWEASLADRIDLVNDTVYQLVTYGALSTGRGRALSAELTAAAQAADRGHVNTATRQIEAFLNTLNVYIRAGLLDEKPADYLIAAITRLELDNLP